MRCTVFVVDKDSLHIMSLSTDILGGECGAQRMKQVVQVEMQVAGWHGSPLFFAVVSMSGYHPQPQQSARQHEKNEKKKGNERT